MPSQTEYVSRLRSALAVSDPELDTSVGTVSRKILDAVAEVMAESDLDEYLIDYSYDIDTRSGAALDAMVALFGFSRLPARRASGTVTLWRQATNTRPIVIPMGTQFVTDTIPPISVTTIVPAVMLEGDSIITVPCQATAPGSAGNITAHSIVRAGSPFSGVSSFTNEVAFTGGLDAESDDALRSRFKRTVFRNLAGTEDMMMGVALENDSVVAANVIGPIKRRREQIELETTGGQTYGDSGIPNAKHLWDNATYPGSAFLAQDLEGENYEPYGVTWEIESQTGPGAEVYPRVKSLDTNFVPPGIYEFDFAYTPRASRNDPANGIVNRVDVWVDGIDERAATQVALIDHDLEFSSTPGDVLNFNNFRRSDGITKPGVGNHFIPLAFCPVMSLPESIEISNTTYLRDVDYWVINDITAEGMSPQSRSGIEWAVGNIPSTGTLFTLTDFTFNAAPREVQTAIQNWRLLTQDVWVHASMPIRLNLHFTVILTEGANATQVRNDMTPVLRNHLQQVGFNGVVQASDLLSIASSIPGVDAVRWTTDDDTTGESPQRYAIQQVDNAGNIIGGTGPSGGTFWDSTKDRTLDVFVDDDSTPWLNEVFIRVRAQNTWGGS